MQLSTDNSLSQLHTRPRRWITCMHLSTDRLTTRVRDSATPLTCMQRWVTHETQPPEWINFGGCLEFWRLEVWKRSSSSRSLVWKPPQKKNPVEGGDSFNLIGRKFVVMMRWDEICQPLQRTAPRCNTATTLEDFLTPHTHRGNLLWWCDEMRFVVIVRLCAWMYDSMFNLEF